MFTVILKKEFENTKTTRISAYRILQKIPRRYQLLNENDSSEELDRICDRQVQVRHITTYKFAADGDELLIKMLGKKRLSTVSNLPDYIAGTIKIDNMHIPVIDPKATRGQDPQEITDSSCVVLTALHGGRHGVTTAAIYPDLKRVLEFIMKQTKH